MFWIIWSAFWAFWGLFFGDLWNDWLLTTIGLVQVVCFVWFVYYHVTYERPRRVRK